MTIPERTREAVLVERLHAKTMARALAWTPAQHEDRYQVQVGDYVMEIGEGAEGEPEILICRLTDGRALEIVTPDILSGDPERATALRQVFAETYETARRIALGVEAVVESLIQRLA
jgi:hypothetical protein